MRRPSPASFANAVACAALVALGAVAVVMVLRIGPLALVLLGLLTLFICTQFSLHDASPTWGIGAFRALLDQPTSPEQRAAQAAERHAALSPLTFYRWCGVVLVAAGAAALAWQYLS